MKHYYNDNDPFAAAWLRNLIAAGHLPAGDVDDRSLLDVRASDLAGYTQVHLFAGIGGWPYALQLAGWPTDRPVWTGSCPCQPLSSAGQRRGHADERHLWPAFHLLIAQCRPDTVFGEQVAGKDGREWLAGICADLERLGYACGAADLCAAGAGAPHIRQRLYWVADRDGGRREACDQGGLADAGTTRLERHAGHGDDRHQPGRLDPLASRSAPATGWPGADRVAGFWSAHDLVPCRDGKTRRTGPGIFPLAHGVSNRVGRLRGYGNAIVPQVAATFISAWLDYDADYSVTLG